jgi:uncharacterized protein YprB with RNaseH-like and TPR domain
MTASPGLLERYRAFQATRAVRDVTEPWEEATPAGSRSIGRSRQRAGRLAELLDGAVEEWDDGLAVRVEQPALPLPVDRAALTSLPFDIDPARPFVCLDTETTGLATGAGTVVFLVGIGRWDGNLFRVTQFFLPDHADEPAFLGILAAELPPESWLVTYNGRSFDWPLLESRYRLHRRVPPAIAGHLDLLPIARSLFRHRLPDARLGTVETAVCGVERIDDLPGAFVPERYQAFLRYGEAGYLHAVALHNEQDVRSLARLLGHLGDVLADPGGRELAQPGDLGRLARAYSRQRRHDDALACLDTARETLARSRREMPEIAAIREHTWLGEERARLLRRMGRFHDALGAWRDVAAIGGRAGTRAWIEIAKLQEHRLKDPAAALTSVDRADALLARARLGGRIAAGLDTDLARRRTRLRGKISRRSSRASPALRLASAWP